MARRYMCEVCNEAIEEGYAGATFAATVSFAPREGREQPSLSVKADVCSGPCLVKYVMQKLLPEIARKDARWRSYGTSDVAPNLSGVNLRFNAGDGLSPTKRLKR